MAANNRYMNVSGCTWTPYSSFPPAVLGSAVNLTGITSARYDEGVSTKKAAADFDGFPTFSVCDYREPKVTLETLDAFAIYTTVAGAKGQVLVNYRDIYNGVTAAGGGKSLTLSNAQIESRQVDEAYREFIKQPIGFGAISTDGATHPAAFAAL